MKSNNRLAKYFPAQKPPAVSQKDFGKFFDYDGRIIWEPNAHALKLIRKTAKVTGTSEEEAANILLHRCLKKFFSTLEKQ